jgi:hypothetical protein
MSRGANKQTGRPDVALSLAIPENVSYVVAESRQVGSYSGPEVGFWEVIKIAPG